MKKDIMNIYFPWLQCFGNPIIGFFTQFDLYYAFKKKNNNSMASGNGMEKVIYIKYFI
jgi:hypothetical protein